MITAIKSKMKHKHKQIIHSASFLSIHPQRLVSPKGMQPDKMFPRTKFGKSFMMPVLREYVIIFVDLNCKPVTSTSQKPLRMIWHDFPQNQCFESRKTMSALTCAAELRSRARQLHETRESRGLALEALAMDSHQTTVGSTVI